MATTPSNFASCGHVGQEILDGSSLKGDRLFVAIVEEMLCLLWVWVWIRVNGLHIWIGGISGLHVWIGVGSGLAK